MSQVLLTKLQTASDGLTDAGSGSKLSLRRDNPQQKGLYRA
jgi:hypothetical protein